jgi:hypothetical protein
MKASKLGPAKPSDITSLNQSYTDMMNINVKNNLELNQTPLTNRGQSTTLAVQTVARMNDGLGIEQVTTA